MARLNNCVRLRRHRKYVKATPTISKQPKTESTVLKTMTVVRLSSERLWARWVSAADVLMRNAAAEALPIPIVVVGKVVEMAAVV